MSNICVLATAEWDRPLWTNKQHLAARLARTHNVWYVDSIALRRPQLTPADLRRAVRRLRRYTLPQRAGPGRHDSVKVITPRVVPLHSGRVIRGYNSLQVSRAVRDWLHSTRPRVLWTFSPVTYGLEGSADVTIYHAVDLLHEFPGVDRMAVLTGERVLAQAGVPAVASSPVVMDHLRSQGFRNVRLWPNVADVDLFERVPLVEPIPGKVVFVGNLTPTKVDFTLLDELRRRVPGIEIHLIGPLNEGGGTETESMKRLLASSQTVLHGTCSLAEVAKRLADAAVGLIPYVANAYTAGVFPMKVYEYLAAGVPVVATDLPSLRGVVGVDLRDHPEDFVRRVTELSVAPLSIAERLKLRRLAQDHSWHGRLEEVEALLDDQMGQAAAGENGRERP